jgi:hypothetical protein
MTDSSLSQSTGEVSLARTGWPGNQDRLVAVDPMTRRQVQNLGSVKSARMGEVDVLNAGTGAQLGRAQVAGKPAR